jgi:hypothetical protein
MSITEEHANSIETYRLLAMSPANDKNLLTEVGMAPTNEVRTININTCQKLPLGV